MKNISDLSKIAKKAKPIKQYLKPFIIHYERIFTDLRHMPITLLEIGVGGYKDPIKGGGSLRMWSDFFPNGTIIGLDINKKSIDLPSNVSIELGSQTDTDLLKAIAAKYGGFDIVIDDASHVTSNTIITYEAIIKHTRLFYVIEDLHMRSAIGTMEYFNGVNRSDFSTQNLCVIEC
jgi:hypothetical protein